MLEKIESEEGFFRKHHSYVESTVSEGQMKEFENLNTNEERFKFVYELPASQKLNIKIHKDDKDIHLAKKLKEAGNKAFKNENYREAWKLYSDCILKTPWAPGNSTELAIAIANRSAALYHMQEYDLTLEDIEVTLSLDYPPELCYKVQDRKARCLLAKKQLKDALKVFQATLTSLDSAKLSTERKRKFQLDIQIMLSMLQKNKNISNAPLENVMKEKPIIGQRSNIYKSASVAVHVENTPSLGRYAVANQNIKVGDTLLVEPAYCSVLLAEHAKTHCLHCFQRLKNPLPCQWCSVVSFCSQQCQSKALTTYHKIECPILDSLWSSGASVTCLMALRILTQNNINYFLKQKVQLGQVPTVYHSNDYLTVFNLVSHEQKRTAEDFFHRADMALFLFKCLQTGGFFHQQAMKDDLMCNEMFIGGILLHHLQILQFNAHEISEIVLNEDNDIDTASSIFLGGGLYPTLALFNHSCDPGIIRYFQGTSVIVHAAKNIPKGDIIAENYGPIFTQTARHERQMILKNQYWFTCSCIPCEDDWPQFKDMDSNTLRFKCNGNDSIKCNNIIEVSVNTMDFMVQCSVCKQYTNILKGLKALQDTDSMFKNAKQYMKNKKVIPALNIFYDLLNRLDETLAPPFRDYHLCQQAIRRCMLYRGNCHAHYITNKYN